MKKTQEDGAFQGQVGLEDGARELYSERRAGPEYLV